MTAGTLQAVGRNRQSGTRLLRLVVALASFVLLASGASAVVPRTAVAQPAPVSASFVPAPASDTSMEAPAAAVVVRSALPATPSPGGSGAGLAPGSSPLVAPHLLAQPQARPPTSPLGTGPGRDAGSRAPPGPAGT